MRRRRLVRRALLAVVVAAFAGAATSVFTAGVSVPATYLSSSSGPASIDDQAAAAGCGTGLANVVNGATGTGANDLVLDGAGGATVRGFAGDDCVMGGGGDDTLRGDADSDVCIGGPGTDSFHPSCETQIQ